MQDERCPSVAHVLARIDGGLARVRVPGGRIAHDRLAAVAAAAAGSGNGTIEITNRANLQVRGVPDGDAGRLAAALEAAGASAGRRGDLRRNILVPPLADRDPSALADPAPIVPALIAALDAESSLDELSAKAGVVIDGGGAFHLGGRRGDVVVTAAGADRWVVAAPGRPPEMIGGAGVPAAVRDALVATLTQSGGDRRVVPVPLPHGAPGPVTVGPLGAGPGWVGAAPPLGRTDAATLSAVADLAARLGDGVVRLTPWRGVVISGVRAGAGPALVAALATLGWCTDADDGRATVVACAGARGCASGHTDAPADALRVAAARAAAGLEPLDLHVSGCAKRCARRDPAAVTLIGVGADRYDVLVADAGAAGGERRVGADLDPAAALAAGRAPVAVL